MPIHNKTLRTNLRSLSFYGLPLALYIVFFIVPSITSLFVSFTSWQGFVNKFNFIGLANYVELLSDSRFYSALLNTLQITVIYTVFVNIVAVILAVLVNNAVFLKGFFKSSFFIPNILAPIIVGFIWTFMFNYNYGILNTILSALGLEALKTDWIGSASIVKYSISAVFIWQAVGFFFVVYLAALQGIPQEILESSALDGAYGLKKFFHIILPMLSNAIPICLTLSLIGGIKLFDLVFVLTYGGPGFSSETITMYIYSAGFASNRNGYGSAISVVMFLLILILTIVQLRLLRSQEAEK